MWAQVQCIKDCSGGNKMKAAPLIIIFSLLLAFSSAQDSNCQSDFWECKALPGSGSGQWKVATLKGDAFEKAIPAGKRTLEANFPRDQKVRKVNITTEVDLEIVSVIGPDIEVISIGGLNKSLRNLCTFATPQLPSLKLVSIDNAEIVNLDYDQLKECPKKSASGEGLTINISNTRLEPNRTQFSIDPAITFYFPPIVKWIELTNVSFPKLIYFKDFTKVKATGVRLILYHACDCVYNTGDYQFRCSGNVDECDKRKPFGPPEPPPSQGLALNPSMISTILPMLIVALLFA